MGPENLEIKSERAGPRDFWENPAIVVYLE